MPTPGPNPPRLLDQVAHACRVRHYSPHTAASYRHWVRRFVLFHGVRHPRTMAAKVSPTTYPPIAPS